MRNTKPGTKHPCLITNTAASLSAITYLRATHNSKNAYTNKDENLLLQVSSYSSSDWSGTTGLERCLKYIDALKKKGFDTDQYLNSHEKVQMMALTSLIRDKLTPAVLYYQFVESENYEIVTAPEIRKSTRFPKSFWMPKMIRNHVANEVAGSLSQQGGSDIDTAADNRIDIDILETTAYNAGKEAIELIADRYRKSNGPFFFGDTVSSVDCLLYGYLAVLRGNSWINNELQAVLKNNLILSKYIDLVHQRIYPSLELPSRTVDLGYDLTKNLKERNENFNRVFQIAVICGVGYMVLGTFFNVPSPSLPSWPRRKNKNADEVLTAI